MTATGKHTPFRLWILIVAWVFQFIFLLIMLGLFIIIAVAISQDTYTAAAYSVVGIYMTLIVACIIINIVEITLCAMINLTPLFYLISNILKSMIWVGLTVALLVKSRGFSNNNDNGIAYSSAGVGFSVVMMFLFLVPTLYGAIVFSKDRRAGARVVAYQDSGYRVPSIITTCYDGAPILRPDFVDLEDGYGHGFRKMGAYAHASEVQRPFIPK